MSASSPACCISHSARCRCWCSERVGEFSCARRSIPWRSRDADRRHACCLRFARAHQYPRVREGATAVTVITVAKLLPCCCHLCGIFFIHASNLSWSAWPGSKSLGDAVILLIFAFVGIEVALIKRRSQKSGAHRSAVGVSRTGDYDGHLPHDPSRSAGYARRRSRQSSCRASRRIGDKFLGNLGRTIFWPEPPSRPLDL